MSILTIPPGHLPERALLILVELEHGPLPAVTLKRKIEQAYALSIEPGAFYKTLTNLERKGWIELADAGTLLHPHSYGLTERGQAALHQYRALASQRRERIPTTDRKTSLRGGIMKLATWIVKLYPRKWRERYEIEMLALLEDHQITLLTVFDLLFGVVDARLDPHYRTERNLLAFNRPHVATLVFLAALALFLFFIQGSMSVIIQGGIILFGPRQPLVIGSADEALLVSGVFLAIMEDFISGLLCFIIMFVAFASMRRIIAARRVGTALFALACFVIPIVIALMFLPYALPPAYPLGTRIYDYFPLCMGLESLMGVLLLTLLKGRQAIATRRKKMVFFVALIDVLLVLRVASIPLLLPSFAIGLFSWINPAMSFRSLIVDLFPFSTINVLLLVLVGSKFGEWTKRFALVSMGLATPIMLVASLLFLIGSVSWMHQMTAWGVIESTMVRWSVLSFFFDQFPIGVAGAGLLLCTLLALAAFRSLLLALNRTPVTKAAMQELPPMEMRQ